jgi:hypothetical protein
MRNDIKRFYKPPNDECFNELKEVCIKFWTHCFSEHDKDFGYFDEKINTIKNLSNDGSNFISMVQMIHPLSRQIIAKSLSNTTKNEISMRLYWCENYPNCFDEYDYFNIWNSKNHVNSI